jgi:hypothetical protein
MCLKDMRGELRGDSEVHRLSVEAISAKRTDSRAVLCNNMRDSRVTHANGVFGLALGRA